MEKKSDLKGYVLLLPFLYLDEKKGWLYSSDLFTPVNTSSGVSTLFLLAVRSVGSKVLSCTLWLNRINSR